MWKVFRRLFGQDDRRESYSPPMSDRERFRRLMMLIANTHEHEMDCHECYEVMDRFVELAMSGASASEALPLVQDHLDRCPACREEYEVLLAALKDAP